MSQDFIVHRNLPHTRVLENQLKAITHVREAVYMKQHHDEIVAACV